MLSTPNHLREDKQRLISKLRLKLYFIEHVIRGNQLESKCFQWYCIVGNLLLFSYLYLDFKIVVNSADDSAVHTESNIAHHIIKCQVKTKTPTSGHISSVRFIFLRTRPFVCNQSSGTWLTHITKV